jgi:hypothetical protein
MLSATATYHFVKKSSNTNKQMAVVTGNTRQISSIDNNAVMAQKNFL